MIELPAPASVCRLERVPADVVHHVVEVVVLGRDGAEAFERFLPGGIDAGLAEGLAHAMGVDLGVGLTDRGVADDDARE